MRARMYMLIAAAPLIPSLAAADSAVQPYPTDQLLLSVERAVDEARWGNDATAADKCIEAVNAAIKAGRAASTAVKVPPNAPKVMRNTREVKRAIPGSGGFATIYVAPLTEVKDFCMRLKGAQGKARLQSSMESFYRKATATADQAGRGEGFQANDVVRKMLADEVAQCKKTVDDAIAAGVPATEVLEVNDHKWVKAKIQVSEAKAKVCQAYADATAKLWESASKAQEASLAPYKKALKGDRWKVFSEHGFININPRGAGGVVLSTPEALARSPLWCETLGDDRDPLHPTWKTRCYRFKGNALAGRPVERTGRGKSPPASAYK